MSVITERRAAGVVWTPREELISSDRVSPADRLTGGGRRQNAPRIVNNQSELRDKPSVFPIHLLREYGAVRHGGGAGEGRKWHVTGSGRNATKPSGFATDSEAQRTFYDR